MKKIIFISLLLLLSSSAAFSQRLEWGVKAGMNVSPEKGGLETGFNGSPMKNTDRFPGFYVGGFAEHRFDETFGVQGELLYSKVLYRVSYEELGTFRMTIDYLVLPVMGKLYLTKGLSLDFGPQFGVLLKDEIRDIGKDRRNFDLSFGVGLSCRIGRRFDVSTRYNWGMIALAKYLDEYNNTFRLGVGYRF